jgi:hypothetical protein
MPKTLTVLFVETVRAQNRRQDHRDYVTKGLVLRVTPRGVKTWALLYMHEKRKRRLTLGEFPAIGLARAR